MKAYDLGAKAIIFSQFVNMLDVSHQMHSSTLTCFTLLFFPYPQPLVLNSIVPYPILHPFVLYNIVPYPIPYSQNPIQYFSNQLLEYRLQRGGIQCSKLLGHMNVDQRDSVSNSACSAVTCNYVPCLNITCH